MESPKNLQWLGFAWLHHLKEASLPLLINMSSSFGIKLMEDFEEKG